MAKNASRNCMFCNVAFDSPEKLTEHLKKCANQTEQCPNCERYIPRSDFAFHYENGCAMLDDRKVPSKKPQQPLPPPAKKNQEQSNTIKCEFCNNSCLQQSYAAHKQYCKYNPKNAQDTDRRSTKPKNEKFTIPCEFCNQQIDAEQFEGHMKTCSSRNPRIRRETEPYSVLCDRCYKEFDQSMYSYHQNNCRGIPQPMNNQNPTNDRVKCRYCQTSMLHCYLSDHERICRVHLANLAREVNQQNNEHHCQSCNRFFRQEQEFLVHLGTCDTSSSKLTYAQAVRKGNPF